ncbi:hypothetical protein L1C53_16405 [Klebsiella pneumoniae]|nr:hypothetical protein [Klebsiella pneumoniae]MCQ0687765.1 hypothetical protein [Klebsiella pneumoniae]MDP0949955.1 hypothetical protein [Klebsiella pneumoniae]
MKNEVEQIALQNDMSIEFVTWFFNEKKVGCGNVWFMMMAAMWEGWKGRSIEMDKLAAENVALKAGASYFSYGSEHNFEWHKTAEEAVEAAEAAIDDYRGEACDGWSEEVDSICWGIIMQSSTKVGERPRNEDDCCDPAIDTVCDYALLPNIETPATERIVAEAEARGVERAIAHLEKKFSNIGVQIMNLQWLADSLREGAGK